MKRPRGCRPRTLMLLALAMAGAVTVTTPAHAWRTVAGASCPVQPFNNLIQIMGPTNQVEELSYLGPGVSAICPLVADSTPSQFYIDFRVSAASSYVFGVVYHQTWSGSTLESRPLAQGYYPTGNQDVYSTPSFSSPSPFDYYYVLFDASPSATFLGYSFQ